jgi:LPS export ABC transporter permease LptG
MRILDRYILKSFLMPFIYCFVGFLAIWLVVDLGGNIPDFLEAKASPARIAYFYLIQMPLLIVLCLPVALLLSLLYSLSHMSRTNEIISMLSAGRSVTRILLPLMGFGFLAAIASAALNYSLAPHAEAVRRVLFDQLRGKHVETSLVAQLFRNRAEHRTWFVQRMRKNSNEFEGVNIIQQDAEGNITRKYFARRAQYNPETGGWNLERGKTVDFDTDGNIKNEELWLDGNRLIENWPETPWRIASANLDAQNLSVPELHDYLRFNADFPRALLAPYRTYLDYRWAIPWWCFVVVLIAAPLGIVYSRRGVLAGVASSIFIFFGTMFLDKLFLALGKGDRIPPLVAAWTPCIFFGLIGLFLLWLRSTNREMPKFRLIWGKP